METGDRLGRRVLAAAPYAASLLLVCLKVTYLFSAEPLTGWDTVGHLHLASVYRGLFADLRSAGYDTGWFLGQPAFVLYPPLFYFVVALLDAVIGAWLGLSASFNAAILLVLLFYSCAYLSLARVLLEDAADPLSGALLAAAGLLVPLGYSGDGLQGAGLVGAIEGTFVSTFGLGLALMALASLERFRRGRRPASLVRYLCFAALLYYTHYLSTIFFCLLLAIYAITFGRELGAALIAALALGPPALAAPVVYLFLRDGAFSSAAAQATYYPPLLSLLGKDFYAAWRAAPSLETLADQLFARLGIARVLPLALFAAGVSLVLRGRLRSPQARFVCGASLLLFWLALDTSPALLLPALPVHWYRAFDFFLTFLSLLAILAAAELARRSRAGATRVVLPAVLLAVLALRFAVWDPLAAEEQPTMNLALSLRQDRDAERLASYLGSLPRGTVILPEVLRTRETHGSPHWLDYLIQSAGHRNALGLTVESSLTAMVTYAYLSQGMGQVFVWGIDPSWAQGLFGRLRPAAPQRLAALPDYLAAAGIEYVVTQSGAARAYADGMRDSFERTFASGPLAVYRVAGALPPVTILRERPWGLVDLAALRGARMAARTVYRDFLFQANWVRLAAGIDPVINLTARPAAIEGLRERLAGLVIVNTDPTPAAYHSLPAWVRSGFRLVLVNFAPQPLPPQGVEVLPPPGTVDPATAAIPGNMGGAQASADPLDPGAQAARRLAPARVAISGSEVRASLVGAGGSASRPGAVEIRLSYSPHWRSADGAPVFQTGLDHMLVLAPEPGQANAELRLDLAIPFARLMTAAMALLALAAACAGPAARLAAAVKAQIARGAGAGDPPGRSGQPM